MTETTERGSRPALWLMGIATVVHTLGYLNASSDHILDTSWPLHARFHTLQAVIWLAGLNGALLAVLLGPYRRGGRWALWLLAGGGAVAHLAYFAALAVFPDGGPPELSATLGLVALALLYFAGLALAFRAHPKSST